MVNYIVGTQTSDKAIDIAEDVAREVQKICRCGLSDEYIGGIRLMCDNDNSTERQVVFLARMISFDGMNSTNLLPILQQWVQTRPTIIVKGVSMTISTCSVYLRELSRPMCIPTTTPSPTVPTTPVFTTDNEAEASSTYLPVIPITAGLGGGMLLLIMIVLLLAIVLIRKRRKSKQKCYHLNRYMVCLLFFLMVGNFVSSRYLLKIHYI